MSRIMILLTILIVILNHVCADIIYEPNIAVSTIFGTTQQATIDQPYLTGAINSPIGVCFDSTESYLYMNDASGVIRKLGLYSQYPRVIPPWDDAPYYIQTVFPGKNIK